MGAFKVYGTSYAKCLDKARKAAHVDRSLDLTQWEHKCENIAVDLYESDRVVAVSAAFDAPQFCREFIDLCDKSKFKNLEIRAYSAVKGKLIAKGKKKGMQKFAWQPYDHT